jgi:hypothetical protein
MNLQSVQKEVGPARTWRPWSAGTSTLYAAASGISAVRLAWFEIMASADYQGSGTQQFADGHSPIID